MATINGVYVFVETEDFTHDVDVTSHAVESGADLTDHVQWKGSSLSIKGKIVGKNYKETLEALKEMQRKGVLVKYVGTEIYSKMLITSFKRTRSSDIKGGCEFTMDLKRTRIAASPYKTKTKDNKTNGGTQQKDQKSKSKYVYHKVKKGDTVWALVNGPYKSLGSSCNDIMKWNPKAFSRKGDLRTLKIGYKLRMGARK